MYLNKRDANFLMDLTEVNQIKILISFNKFYFDKDH